jgi:hypothetical protein
VFYSRQARHAGIFLLYALVVWTLLLVVAACLAPQEASWLPGTLWKYFPRPTPYAARMLGAVTVALFRAIRTRIGGRASTSANALAHGVPVMSA